MISIKMGNSAIIKQFYGADVSPLPYKSIAVYIGDEISAVAGMVIKAREKFMFSDITERLRLHSDFKRVVAIVSGMIKQWIPNDDAVFSIADESFPGSVLLLKHMGFEHVVGDVWGN